MKTISNESRRRPARYRLLHAALIAVTLFGSGCYGTAATMVADAGEPEEAATSQTGGAGGRSAVTSDAGTGGRSPETIDAGTGIEARPDGPTNPPSTKFAVGTVCIGNADCATGFCVDGVCCDTSCTGSCQSCAVTGKIGTCAPVRSAEDDTCTGTSICNPSGLCRRDIGETCSGSSDCATGNCVDGVCCGSASCGTCLSCGVAGSLGSCTPMPRLTEDADSGCTGASTCNGVGDCRAKNGQACVAGADCASQQCVDGICCESACTGTCYSCNQPGKLGTCAPLDHAEDPIAAIPCAGSAFCEAALAGTAICRPKISDDQFCAFGWECASGVCATYYRDVDGDGYGHDPVTVCGKQPPAGTTAAGGDCCESAANTHPGVTAYSSVRNACGTFDYNCDGREEKQYNATLACAGRILGNGDPIACR